MIEYVKLTRVTLQKASDLAGDAGKVKIAESIAKLEAVSTELYAIKKVQDDAALSKIANSM